MTYRENRSLGYGPLGAAYESVTPLRVRAALHILRGRPTIYGVVLGGPIVIGPGNDDLLVASSTIYGASPNP